MLSVAVDRITARSQRQIYVTHEAVVGNAAVCYDYILIDFVLC